MRQIKIAPAFGADTLRGLVRSLSRWGLTFEGIARTWDDRPLETRLELLDELAPFDVRAARLSRLARRAIDRTALHGPGGGPAYASAVDAEGWAVFWPAGVSTASGDLCLRSGPGRGPEAASRADDVLEAAIRKLAQAVGAEDLVDFEIDRTTVEAQLAGRDAVRTYVETRIVREGRPGDGLEARAIVDFGVGNRGPRRGGRR